MSSTVSTRKKQKSSELKKNIRFHRKELGNGDLTKELKSAVLNDNRKNAKLDKQLANITKPMKQYDKTMTLTFNQQIYSAEQIQKEKKTFTQTLKKISKHHATLQEKLANLEDNTGNKNYYYSKNKRLPNTIEEIDDDIDLARFLLKNPNKMTPEEKAFIASFNNKEFKLFIKYLQLKDKELKWQGNGYGSGHYLNTFISIYRKTGDDEKARHRTLKNFLKTNYTKGNKNKQQPKESQTMWNEEQIGVGDNLGNTQIDDEHLLKYELQAQELMAYLDEYKKLMSFEKEEAKLKKFIKTNNLLENKLNNDKNNLLQDIENRKQLNKDKSQNKYDEFMQEQRKIKEIDSKYFLISFKIHKYMEEYNLTCFELAKTCLESNDDPYGKNKWIYIDFAMKRFEELQILNKEEAESLNAILQKYSGSRMRIDIFLISWIV